jgi:hypothetical protein
MKLVPITATSHGQSSSNIKRWAGRADARLRGQAPGSVSRALLIPLRPRARHPDRSDGRPLGVWPARPGPSFSVSRFARRKSATRFARGSRKAAVALPGTPQHAFSGLIKCEVCGSSFVMKSARAYAYVNGKICSNNIHVRRDILEDRLSRKIQTDLLRDEVVDDFTARLARALRRPDPTRARRQELAREVQNIVDAIGKGLLSPALSARLQAAEQQLAALPAPDTVIDAKDVLRLVGPTVDAYRRRVRNLPETIREAPDVAREAIRDGWDRSSSPLACRRAVDDLAVAQRFFRTFFCPRLVAPTLPPGTSPPTFLRPTPRGALGRSRRLPHPAARSTSPRRSNEPLRSHVPSASLHRPAAAPAPRCYRLPSCAQRLLKSSGQLQATGT